MEYSELGDAALRYVQHASYLSLGVVALSVIQENLAGRPRLIRVGLGGIGFALLALLSMSAPILLPSDQRIDLRNALIALAVVFSGPTAGLITATTAAAYRIWLGGSTAAAGVLAIWFGYLTSVYFARRLTQRKLEVRYAALAGLGVLAAIGMIAGSLALADRQAIFDAIMNGGPPVVAVVPISTLLLGAIMLQFQERQALLRSLSESRNRLDTIINNLPLNFVIRDLEDRYVFINKQMEDFAQRPLVGTTRQAEFDRLGFDLRSADLDRETLQSGEPLKRQASTQIPGDRRTDFVIQQFPLRDADGRIVEIAGFGVDVTDVTSARSELATREASLRRLQRALVQIIGGEKEDGTDVGKFLNTMTRIAGEAMQTERTLIFLTPQDEERAECLSLWLRSANLHSQALGVKNADFSAILELLQRDRFYAVEDVRADERFRPLREQVEASGARALLYARIGWGNRVQGCLVFNDVEGPRQWTEEEKTFALALGEVASLAISEARVTEAFDLLNLVDYGIFANRPDGRIIFANRAALAMAGVASGMGLIERSLDLRADLFPAPERPLEGDSDVSLVYWSIDGQERELEIRRTRASSDRVVSIIEDVTVRNMGEAQRRALEAGMMQASRMEAMGQLAGGVAHDFNNLLAAVIGFAGLLADDLEAEPERRRYVERILSAATRGKDLVAQILGFARAREVERRSFDLRNVLNEVRGLLEGTLPSSTQVDYAIPEEPVAILGNETHLAQLIVNLCINSNDSLNGAPGSIAITLKQARPNLALPGPAIRPGQLTIGAIDADAAYAEIVVEDTGCGIPPDSLPRIFEPFYTTKARGHGTGLGLPVVHSTVLAYQGAALVESAPNQGTRIAIYLPLSQAQTVEPETLNPTNGELRGTERILLVDDEPDIADSLSIGLGRLGYEAVAASNPEEVLECLRADSDAWDLLITDWTMPGMSGDKLAARAKEINPKIRVILTSGLDEGVRERSGGIKHIDAFIEKPATVEQVAACVRYIFMA